MQAQIRGVRKLYEADNDHELLAKMRDDHPCPEVSVEVFIKEWAKRMLMWDGSRVSTESVGDFMADMQRCGIIRVWN